MEIESLLTLSLTTCAVAVVDILLLFICKSVNDIAIAVSNRYINLYYFWFDVYIVSGTYTYMGALLLLMLVLRTAADITVLFI